jgi:argininosuccinate lyase
MGIVVFIESNTTGTGELFIEAAIRRGLVPYFLTADRRRYPFLNKHHVVAVAADTSDVDAVTAFVSGLDDVVAVFSTSEYYIEIASEVAVRLGLHSGNSEAIRRCRDKFGLARILREQGVAAPLSTLLSLEDSQAPALEILAYPVVVKPRTGSGSVGVRLIAGAGELARHCAAARAEGASDLVVQDYAPGKEYSVETLTSGGRTQVVAIVRKHLGPEPAFVEIGHSCPATLTGAQAAAIEDTVVRALAAVGFRFGPAHTELRVSGDTVTIIEINPRLAGGLIPVLLEHVFEIDLIDHVLGMWLGEEARLEVSAKRYGAIRFALSPRTGLLTRPVHLPADARRPELRLVHPLKEPGAFLTLQGDFRDRAAAIVCAGDDRDEVEEAARDIAAQIVIDVAPAATPEGGDSLPDHLRDIVYREEPEVSSSDSIAALLDINEAHLLMLAHTGLVPVPKVRALLQAQQALREDDFAALRALPRPRGLYMAFEQHLISVLGEDVGGVLQTGRSRNDLNATTTKLLLRSGLCRVFDALWALRSSLLFRASQSAGQPFPIYSQYQPASPGTLSHQLLAFEHALGREAALLLALVPELNVSPLGAGAGAGTTLPIETELTCKLLGFDAPAVNSLDAVASRSAALHYLSAVHTLGLVLSRIAQDLQVWSMAEISLISFAPELCGASSMLPQKRNPFLVEFVKARTALPLGLLCSCSAAVAKTPYANSFEAGSMVNRIVGEATSAICDALVVTTALIDGIEVAPDRAAAHVASTGVASMAVAEALVARGDASFRTAHGQVTTALRSAGGDGAFQRAALEALDGDLMAQGPLAWAERHRSGGGPGQANARDGLVGACRALAADAVSYRLNRRDWDEGARIRALACEQMIRAEPLTTWEHAA